MLVKPQIRFLLLLLVRIIEKKQKSFVPVSTGHFTINVNTIKYPLQLLKL